jgi:hypothetical protein
MMSFNHSFLTDMFQPLLRPSSRWLQEYKGTIWLVVLLSLHNNCYMFRCFWLLSHGYFEFNVFKPFVHPSKNIIIGILKLVTCRILYNNSVSSAKMNNLDWVLKIAGVYVCVCVRVRACMCTCMLTHTHTHTHKTHQTE